MRILMVYCNTPQDNTVPIGVTQLISCLKKAGHEVELFHTTFYKQGFKSSAQLRMDALQYKPVQFYYQQTEMIADFRKKIISFEPELIGFSVFEVTYPLLKRLLGSIQDLLRKNKIKVAVGGILAIFWPELIAALEGVDFISIGEAESTFVQLCGKISAGKPYTSQAGFWVKKNGSWFKNKVTQLTDLESLPLSDPGLFGRRYIMKPMMGRLRKTITIELSRGCPFKCTYCADASLNKKFRDIGRWYRIKSIAKIEEEYSLLVKKYKPEFVFKFSETFLASGRKWLSDYCTMYKRFRIPFWTESRPETVTEDNIRMLRGLNCIRFSIGLESGNEEYRKRYLNRGYSNNQVIRAANTLRASGISFSMNLIIGFPFETRAMIFDGIEVLRLVRPDSVSTFLFTPYKGCVLRQVCEEHGMIDKDFIGDDYFQMKYALRNNTLGNEIIGLWRTVPLYIRLGKKRYPLIRKAENMDAQGDKVYAQLKKEYYELMGWA